MFIISKEQEYNYLTRHCSLATNIQIYEATHINESLVTITTFEKIYVCSIYIKKMYVCV